MLVILLSWMYMFWTLTNFGILASFVLQKPHVHKFIHLLIGVLLIMVVAHVWAFFAGFGILFHVVLLGVNVLVSSFYFTQVKVFVDTTFTGIMAMPRNYIMLLGAIFLLILYQSSLSNAYLDNEVYYIQTIKWLNEYGFVKGLANFDILLAQTSGWHIVQSAFSFHFLHPYLNDLGGFFLVLLNGFAIHHFSQEKNKKSLFAWLPILNVLLFYIASTPSPDLGIFIFFIGLLMVFWKAYRQPTPDDFMLACLLFLGAFLIKITAFGLVLFPLILLLKWQQKSAKVLWISLFFGVLMAGLWMGKNLVLSGLPLYPSYVGAAFVELPNQLPKEVYAYSLSTEKLYDFFAKVQEVQHLSFLQLIIQWFSYSKVSMLMNTLIFLLLSLFPLLLRRKSWSRKYKVLYFSFVVQIVFLACTSPNYRFALHYVAVFVLVLLAKSITDKRQQWAMIALSQVVVGWGVFFPATFDTWFSKSMDYHRSKFQVENLVFPKATSALDLAFQTERIDDLYYQSPSLEAHYWISGDGELPCVHHIQLLKSAQQTQYYPKLLDSTNIAKGFYSKATTPFIKVSLPPKDKGKMQ